MVLGNSRGSNLISQTMHRFMVVEQQAASYTDYVYMQSIFGLWSG